MEKVVPAKRYVNDPLSDFCKEAAGLFEIVRDDSQQSGRDADQDGGVAEAARQAANRILDKARDDRWQN